MKNRNSLFLVFCLCLTMVCLGGYTKFVSYFNGESELQAELRIVKLELAKQKTQNELLAYQLKDFQQTVASVLPQKIDHFTKFEIKNLASVVRRPASIETLDLSAAIYERGKSYFNRQKYDLAIAEFSKLSEKFPFSIHSVEAQFFIAESYFLKKDYPKSLQYIEHMVNQYPQNELTGFILLRMGQISQINDQKREAKEIYKTILNSFKNPDLKKQARSLYEGIATL